MLKRWTAFALLIALALSLSACGKRGMQKYTDYSFDYFDTVTTLVGYCESDRWIGGADYEL